jgi:hypothetical protein
VVFARAVGFEAKDVVVCVRAVGFEARDVVVLARVVGFEAKEVVVFARFIAASSDLVVVRGSFAIFPARTGSRITIATQALREVLGSTAGNSSLFPPRSS